MYKGCILKLHKYPFLGRASDVWVWAVGVEVSLSFRLKVYIYITFFLLTLITRKKIIFYTYFSYFKLYKNIDIIKTKIEAWGMN